MNTRILTTVLLATAGSLSAQWNSQAPANFPSARSGAAMAFDPTTNRALLFGGTAGFSTSNQTWAFNGLNWAQLTPTASPTGKTGMQLVHDPVRGVFVMYGSSNTSPFGGPSVNQTWEFDGTTWTQVFPATTPGGLGNYGACYDSVRGRVVIYGGTANSFFPIAESGTWEYDGTNWSLRTTTGTPGPLERPAMCFHTGLGRSVLFGGIDPQIGGVDTTWLYDGTSWTAAPVTGARPAVRTGATMTYDSVRGVCVLTGGLNPTTGAPIVDTWEFDGVGWTQLPTGTTGRYAAAMTFMPNLRQVVLFGGYNPVTFADLGDTWLFGAKVRTFGTGCVGSSGVPALSATDAPRLGQNYTLTLNNLPPSSSVAFFAVGWSDQTSPLGPLPLSLAAVGMPGCSLLVSGEVLLVISATGGVSTLVTSLPNDAAFVGIEQFHQGCSIDPAANPAGLATSNAVRGVIGR